MTKTKQLTPESASPKVCGIVMPISECDGCAEHHWLEVKAIVTDAVAAAGFDAKLVSCAREIGVIHERIVQNLYENPIVVCDVSGRNPNVMFELGMRLAFDKPAIIIKDDKTNYSFDTSGIEHLGYPRDLRFSRIVEFKKELTERVTATYARSKNDPTYTTFLKRFSKIKVAKMEPNEVSGLEYLQKEIGTLKEMIASSSRLPPSRLDRPSVTRIGQLTPDAAKIALILLGGSRSEKANAMDSIREMDQNRFDKLISEISKYDLALADELIADRDFHDL